MRKVGLVLFFVVLSLGMWAQELVNWEDISYYPTSTSSSGGIWFG